MPHKFTNSLINESSLYLQQHVHNPVNWHPWSDEALQKAKQENKIILVSIGYAACHWCHVMERESFENEAVAEIMNQHFINIKIDREERPDLDHIYMDAVQAITGSGGWPLNVFLTPDAKPFYGGTYFPPVNAYNRSSWTEVINAIAGAWKQKAHEITVQAESLLQHLKQSGNFDKLSTNATQFFKDECELITANILKQADKEWGGFGKAPKFPQTLTIQYLLQSYYYTGNTAALEQALLSVNKMINGGLYDHIGGGFARYSTDEEWLAPHFEKMLYDNALLINVLCDAYQITGNEKYADVIHQTISFLQREMMDAQGGFYAALDADSEGEEGKFYVWSKAEIETILMDEAPLFCAFYDVTEQGNWEGKNILRILKEPAEFAKENNADERYLLQQLQYCRNKLLAERSKRIRPATDDKILLGWNALLITALSKAAAVFNNSTYKKLAEDTFHFIQAKFKKSAQEAALMHTYKNNVARYPAFLDDYAFLIQACIQLQEITFNTSYLVTAAEMCQYVIENFREEQSGLFAFTHQQQQDVVMRKKELYDGATPSGNSIMAENLLYLSIVFDNNSWQQIAEKATLSLSKAIISYPTSFAVWASIYQKLANQIIEIVIIGSDFAKQKSELMQNFIPGKVLQGTEKSNEDWPLLKGKEINVENSIFLCRNYMCFKPVTNVENVVNELKKCNYSTRLSQ